MKSISQYQLRNYIVGIILLAPIIIIYYIVFYYSMPLAFDREIYLKIMSHPFQGREEPLIHIISYLLNFIFSNPVYKLFFVQIFFTSILILSLIKSSESYNLKGLARALILIFIFFSVFSNMLVIQLRIGYAAIIFIALVYLLDKRPNVKNIPYFLLPCFMHTGLIPAVALYYIFYWFNINNFKKFSAVLASSVLGSTFVIKFLPDILTSLNFSTYYFYYLDKDGDFGRALPFSVLFYLILSIPSIYIFRKRIYNNPDFWFGNFGLLLVYTGLFLDFYVSFKMLVPFSAFLYIYIVNQVFSISTHNSKLLFIVILIMMPLCFLMLTNQAGIL